MAKVDCFILDFSLNKILHFAVSLSPLAFIS
jgi:hypothetical protein